VCKRRAKFLEGSREKVGMEAGREICTEEEIDATQRKIYIYGDGLNRTCSGYYGHGSSIGVDEQLLLLLYHEHHTY
jgi:hypothetical protein